MTRILGIPASNIARFNTYAMAAQRRNSQRYNVPIIMGDDGLFWVASTNRQASKLINAGYEAV